MKISFAGNIANFALQIIPTHLKSKVNKVYHRRCLISTINLKVNSKQKPFGQRQNVIILEVSGNLRKLHDSALPVTNIGESSREMVNSGSVVERRDTLNLIVVCVGRETIDLNLR